MKLSLSWIFDHIDAQLKKVDVAGLAHTFNLTTAQVECWHKISFDPKPFTLAQVTELDTVTVKLHSPEWKETITLPSRKELLSAGWYLIKKEGKTYKWATTADLGSSKEELLPALHCTENDRGGSWKKNLEVDDYIFEVDNNSLSHRPDLWGHRGIAREMAAILNLPLKPLEKLIENYPVATHKNSAPATADNPIAVRNDAPQACKHFAGLYIDNITPQGSELWMTLRLCRVDSKPMHPIVDATNYVMLDLGQPMHAFDAQTITTKTIAPRMAKKGEKLTVLDGQTIELTAHDLVITDGKSPIALAGVMGGFASAVHEGTTSVFIEAALFDGSIIRATAMNHKKRTEASARFEKSIDPNGNIPAIKRLAHILTASGMPIKPAREIIALGTPVEEGIISIAHDLIERRIGATITPAFVQKTLEKLGIGVIFGNDRMYSLTIPTYRSRDITIPEDIIEEIARYFGYDNIPRVLPAMQRGPSDLTPVMRVRAIKNALAYGMRMRELETYSLFDEVFLRELQWQPAATVAMKNALSEHYYRLVTSLVPHLLKAIGECSADHENLRFFEWARTWKDEKNILEKKALAGIIYLKKQPVDFYEAKNILSQLFAQLHMNVTWHKLDTPEHPWYAQHQTAKLVHNGAVIGTAGIADPTFLQRIALGSAFIFELDGDYLLSYQEPLKQFIPLAKYPPIERDISMLLPFKHTVDEVITRVTASDTLVENVTLVDFFSKKEWLDKRSITIRCVLRNPSATMTREEADTIMTKVNKTLHSLGAEIR